MTILQMMMAKTLAEKQGICFAAEGSAGGGADDNGAGDDAGGDNGQAGGDGAGGAGDNKGGSDDAQGGAGDNKGGDGDNNGGDGDNKPWYETREWTDPALQEQLIKAGYHKGTPEEALEKVLKNEASLTQRLGKPADQFMDKPAEDQALTDYFKSNADVFKVPEKPDGYEITMPEDMPESLPIDENFLGAFKEFAHENAYPPEVVQGAVNFYADTMKAQFIKAETTIANLEEKLNTELQAEWGADWKSNKDLATRTFQTLAAKLKLDPDQTKLIASKLNDDMGDAALLKFFNGIAKLTGEDGLVIPKDADEPALDLANAQQRKAQIMEAHTGEMAQARGNTQKIRALQEELKGLNAIIEQHS